MDEVKKSSLGISEEIIGNQTCFPRTVSVWKSALETSQLHLKATRLNEAEDFLTESLLVSALPANARKAATLDCRLAESNPQFTQPD